MAAGVPSPDDSWWQIAGAVFGGGAIVAVWRPLGQWLVSRWDAGRNEKRSELSTCRQQIEELRGQFEAYRTESQRTILELSVEVARLQTQVVERERDVLELRQQLQRPARTPRQREEYAANHE